VYNKTFVLPTVKDREESLRILLSSITAHAKNWDICICAQGYKQGALDKEYPNAKILCFPDKQGCFGARKRILEKFEYDVYCNIDDDMELTENFCLDKAADLVLSDKWSGFISGNWARTRNQCNDKAMVMYKNKPFIKQNVVHTGGGMVYSKRIVPYLLELPDNLGYEDAEMSGYIYSKGFDNYRYMHSLLVHRVVTKGGLQQWRKESEAADPMTELFKYEPEKKVRYKRNNCFLEPTAASLTKKAKELHRVARELAQ